MDTNDKARCDELVWVGNSPALEQMQQILMTLADTRLPVLITGQRGTGKGIAAYTIHNQGVNQQAASADGKPYIVTDCQHWRDPIVAPVSGQNGGNSGGQSTVGFMADCWQKAQGGTLFLRNVDALDPLEADQIKDYWLSMVSQQSKVRLIASVGEINHSPTHRFHINQNFVDWLHYHCLTVALNSLAQRKQDIKALVAYYAKQDRTIAGLTFTAAAWSVLTGYSWPGNVKQLKRCLEKLVVLESGRQISESLLLQHFPAMSQRRIMLSPAATASIPLPKSNGSRFNGRRAKESQSFSQQILGQSRLCNNEARCAAYLNTTQALGDNAANDQTQLRGHHPALDKAIEYICKNYKTSFSMTELASKACVSPSHLSFLFKRYLGQSFKQILLALRIDEAVRLLNTQPHRQVTHICDDVGFSDLSFFERKFKTMVGISPGAYRDQYGKSYQQQ